MGNPSATWPLVRALQALARELALWLGLAMLCAAVLWPRAAQAQDVQPVPTLTGRVIDSTGTLKPEQLQSLTQQLAALESSTGAQVVVLMVASTAPEDITAYAQRVADAWRIGRRQVGDGVLIVVAREDRRVRIEVAKALEGALPDLAARQIIEQTLRPAFRQDDYAGGLSQAIERMAARIRGEGLPAGPGHQSPNAEPEGAQIDDLLPLAFIGLPLLALFITQLFGRKLGSLLLAGGAGFAVNWLTHSIGLAIGAALVTLVVVGLLGLGAAASRRGARSRSSGHDGGGFGWGGGGGGWSSGGSSNDGFSSGGGGDFGGGGASGDW